MVIQQTAIAPDGKPFQLIQLTNQSGMTVQFTDWGATWTSCQLPINGQQREVLLGCALEKYPQQQAYLGASIGRYANRIANAQFELNGELIQVTANQGKHLLHGGNGFDQRRWKLEEYGSKVDPNCPNGQQNQSYFVRFSLFSANGDQGFTGNLHVNVTYTLTDQNEVKIEYSAICDQDTALNLTNHAYFNLENAIDGTDIRHHQLSLNADIYLPVDAEGIPNASLAQVVGTRFDFRHIKSITQDFLPNEQHTKGYDHSFLINSTLSPCALLYSPNKDLQLTVTTSQPAVHIYTGNYLNGTPNRSDSTYADFAGIALETQCLPDSPNHPEWENSSGITKAYQPYYQWTCYQFSINYAHHLQGTSAKESPKN